LHEEAMRGMSHGGFLQGRESALAVKREKAKMLHLLSFNNILFISSIFLFKSKGLQSK